MRATARIAVVTALSLAAMLVVAGAASASAKTLSKAPPAWFTPAYKAAVDASGTRGVPLADGPGALDVCPGVDPNSPTPATSVVSAGTCEVFPYGCTANFIFYASGAYYVGTAGHCVDKVGQSVYMQVSTPGVGASIANVGTVSKFTNGGVGNDYSVIQIAPGFTVDPKIPTGGPQGIYTGCGPEVVRHYGHGYGVAVAQGKQEGGVATNWFDDAYGWTGVGAPGDSGSAVVTSLGLAAGDFTHLIVDTRFPGSDLAGTRITKILSALGASFYLVNADGTFSRETTTSCGSPGRLKAPRTKTRKPRRARAHTRRARA